MNAGVLLFDSSGRVTSLLTTDFPAPHFNGGTPVGDLGSLVIAPLGTPAAYLGGLPYTAQNAIVTDDAGAIVAWEGGLPVTAVGLAIGIDALPVTWVAGIPISAAGRVCVAAPTPPVDLSAFDNGFSGGFS